MTDLLSWAQARRGCREAIPFLSGKTPAEAFTTTNRADWLMWALVALEVPSPVVRGAFFAAVDVGLGAVPSLPIFDVVVSWAKRVASDPPQEMAQLNGQLVQFGQMLSVTVPAVSPEQRPAVETVLLGVMSFARQQVKLDRLRADHDGTLPEGSVPLVAQLAQSAARTVEACCRLRDGGVYSERVLAAIRSSLPTDFDSGAFADEAVSSR